jgi:hypothetical protein
MHPFSTKHSEDMYLVEGRVYEPHIPYEGGVEDTLGPLSKCKHYFDEAGNLIFDATSLRGDNCWY